MEAATVQPIVTAIAPAAKTVSQVIGTAKARPAAMANRSSDEEDDEAAQDRDEQRGPPETPQRRAVGQRRDQGQHAERDVEDRQGVGPQAAHDERIGPDLPDPATGLERGEHAGHEKDQSSLLRSDAGSGHEARDRGAALHAWVTAAVTTPAVTMPCDGAANALRRAHSGGRPQPGYPRTRPTGAGWGKLRPSPKTPGDPKEQRTWRR